MQSHNLVEIEGAAELSEEAAETWGHMLATEFRSSTYAEDVDNALQSLGYVPVREDTSSGLAVDFMLYLEDGNVAVEVDGPSHLNRTTLGPNGRTRLKQRMLRSMGYTLLCVPYHHWQLGFASEPAGADGIPRGATRGCDEWHRRWHRD